MSDETSRLQLYPTSIVKENKLILEPKLHSLRVTTQNNGQSPLAEISQDQERIAQIINPLRASKKQIVEHDVRPRDLKYYSVLKSQNEWELK